MSGDGSEPRQVPQGLMPVQVESGFIAALNRCATQNQIVSEDYTVASIPKPIIGSFSGDMR